MLPSLVANELRESVKRFLRVTFPATTRGFLRSDGSTAIEELVNKEGEVFKGPYLSIGLPYRTIEVDGNLPFKVMDPGFKPYQHQLLAFSRLCGKEPQSTLIATGTGSGKTECFMFPVLDHCAVHSNQGIKAVVVYPMNALATDQARRFAKEIYKNTSLRGRVRVGLFVGDSDTSPDTEMTERYVITCKKTLREDPPDILLTNYKMLDYLLIRPKDQAIWRFNNPGDLRFLVVDELHTFDGAQGTDLSCLIRRLRNRLDSGPELACVGTSATIGSQKSVQILTEYASEVFATQFDNRSVILEDRLTADEFIEQMDSQLCACDSNRDGQDINFSWPNPNAFLARPVSEFPSSEDLVAAHANIWFSKVPQGLSSSDTRLRQDARLELGLWLSQHPVVHDLLKNANRVVDSNIVVADWKNRLRCSEKEASAMLYSLCSMMSMALRLNDATSKNTQPLVQLRFQLWLRELRRMVASVEAQPQLAFADDLPDVKHQLYLPVLHCRECYTTGWVSWKKRGDSTLSSDLTGIYQAYFGQSPDTVTLFPIVDGEAPKGKGTIRHVCSACGYTASESVSECPECGDGAVMHRLWLPDMNVNRQSKGESLTRFENTCPSCGAIEGLSILGSRAASLSSVVIGQTLTSSFSEDKKLIAFSDSVQDAAHRAGFFSARTWRQVVREAIYQAIHQRYAGMTLQQTADGVSQFWMEKLGEAEFCAKFIPPDLQWRRDWEELQRAGELPKGSDLAGYWVHRRLVWEVITEFGLASRIGRTLEREGKATVAPDLKSVASSIAFALPELRESIEELHSITAEDLKRFILGLLWRLRTKGAFYHDYVREYLNSGGREYLLNKLQFLPGYGKTRRPPVFLSSGKVSANFEDIEAIRNTWFKSWFNKTLAADNVLATASYLQAYHIILDALCRTDVLREHSVKGNSVWSLNASKWYCASSLAELGCSECRHRIQIPAGQVDDWVGVGCQRVSCSGSYVFDKSCAPPLPSRTPPVRLIASEHSAVLDSDTRKFVEESFKNGSKPWDYNLLSATPTMEMGIDIGDLSTVLLCSVPPGQANYLQRIGRAGRKDGNAINVTVANGSPHDLYFYDQPEEMMSGDIKPPGIFLQATAVLERQLVAFCFDQWSRTGVPETAIPGTLRGALNGIENRDVKIFPNNLIDFIRLSRKVILSRFLAMFPEIDDDGKQKLTKFLFDEGPEGIAFRLTNRLELLVSQRESFRKRIDELKREQERLKKIPTDEATEEELEAVIQERYGLIRFLAELNKKQTLNFFTDEGLLPNYAFPEEGVKLHSVIYRRTDKSQSVDAGSGSAKNYEKTTFEFSRPAQAALSELAPENHFYGVSRRVEVDQVDLSVSDAEEWRLCDKCHYAENITIEDKHRSCPRCGSDIWANVSQKQTLLKLKQVFANSNDRDSRIADDNDQREPLFFNRQLLVDIPHGISHQAYVVDDESFPFGFEYIYGATFREINFGQVGENGNEIEVAGLNTKRPGFRICKHCGKVKKKGRNQLLNHAFSCKLRRDGQVESADDYYQALYLYRELNSEAIRLAIPLAEVESSDVRKQSLIASLHLGLKRYFNGDVGHLQVTTYSEPIGIAEQRQHYLVILDTIPGGTGYLKELLRDPKNFRRMFQEAYNTLASCSCNERPDKDGCYRCIYAYRESRKLEITSRDAAKELLGRILDEWSKLIEVETLEVGDHNALLESELEQLFIEKLTSYDKEIKLSHSRVHGKNGYVLSLPGEDGKPMMWQIEPQVMLGAAEGVSLNSKPDFLLSPLREYPDLKPVAVFMDGFSYHKNTVANDLLKRSAILQTGRYHVWSLNWHDLPKTGSALDSSVVEWMSEPVNTTSERIFDQVSARVGRPSNTELTQFSQKGPFRWLLAYLTGKPKNIQMLSWLALAKQFSALKVRDTSAADAILDNWPDPIPEVWKIEHLNGNTVAGSRTLHDKPELTLISSLPKQSLQNLDQLARDAALILYLDDDDPDHTDYEQVWRRFWAATNLFQFLSHFLAVSKSGSFKAELDDLLTKRSAISVVDEPIADPVDWEEPLALTVYPDELRELMDFSPPEVGVDLQNENSEVEIEFEWLWRDLKIALAASADESLIELYRSAGWWIATDIESELNALKEKLSQVGEEQGK